MVVVSSIPSPSSFLSSLSPPPSTPPPPSPNPAKSSSHLRPSFSCLPPSPRTCSRPRHVTCASGRPSPVPEDPLGKDSTTGFDLGLEVTFYRIRDGMQIFFSVLFWMSIFFWACAWDGRDNTRPRKGSRFRR
eukprot:TRINITY_DN4204_c0_g1_i1.p1 TRINITY_DN4204_c0_g1~~TRINITY_DN4204_c0_g1_i1.p1  ORF type:complete len:132 (-),score=18.21 TRINITY_DN4204_c0_g1_i1:178-573(-)